MSFKTITVTRTSHLLTITINRPEHRNSLTSATIRELCGAFDDVSKDNEARCVLLTGAGTEAFCAGADLHELRKDSSPDARRAFFNSIALLVQSIYFCPVPVVCAVHGYALAGGCGLVSASDIVIAADDAIFALPEVGIGLAPMVVMAPLYHTIDARVLAHMALTGQRIPAIQALEAGLVTRVVPKLTLIQEAHDVCDSIMKQSPGATRATKSALRQLNGGDNFRTATHELADRSALVSLEADAVEGLQAFLDKRQPAWRKI